MSQDVTTTEGREIVAADPRGAPAPMFAGRRELGYGANVGAIAVEEQRAIAEVQGKIIIAQRCPRDLSEAREELKMACASLEFAQTAFYTVPNRGSGPSIRFAEEVGRIYGNFDFGHRELSRSSGDGTIENPGKSEIEVYAWDMQKNNYSRRQITVVHVVDTKQGPKVLRDQADIDNKIANVASKQMRGRMLAILPKWLVAEGVALCKRTLAGQGEKPITVRIQAMQDAFSRYGVTVQMLEAYMGHKLAECTVDDLADMQGVISALKDGTKVSEFFGAKDDAAAAGAEGAQVQGAKPAPRASGGKKEEAKADPKKEEPVKEEAKKEEPRKEEQKPAEPAKEADKPAPATEAADKPAEPAPDGAQSADGDAEPELF